MMQNQSVLFTKIQAPLREKITSATREAESNCVHNLLPLIRFDPQSVRATQELAKQLIIITRRARQKAAGADALMNEFSLSSTEGIALMCLAEALLRIPDKTTADNLIRDKLSQGQWEKHLGNSSSLFVNAACWGLVLTGKFVDSDLPRQQLGFTLSQTLKRLGEPVIRQAMRLAMKMLGDQFVMGEAIGDALLKAKRREAQGFQYSYDMLGEAAVTQEDAQRYFLAYEQAIHAIGQTSLGTTPQERPGISVKLSALHPRYCRAQRERVLNELLPKLHELMRLAKKYQIGLNVDAEESERLELSLDLFEILAFDSELTGWDGFGIVAQAYQKRCPYLIDWIVDLAQRSNRRFMVRLVKGAYWDSEIKRAQIDGQTDYPVYTRKTHTDVSYVACAQKLLLAGDRIYPQFATHNALTLASILALTDCHARAANSFEFQCLYGMGESLYETLLKKYREEQKPAISCRIYAPVGSHKTLLAYLVRRLLENGANTSFVNQIVNPNISVDELLINPCALAEKAQGMPHPNIPLPSALYGNRINSFGLDLNSEYVLTSLDADLTKIHQQVTMDPYVARSIVGNGIDSALTTQKQASSANSNNLAPNLLKQTKFAIKNEGNPQAIHNPAKQEELIGYVYEASATTIDEALHCAVEAMSGWAQTTAAERAKILLAIADQLQAQQTFFVYLAIHEAGKTIPNAMGEIREAIDFCRYYAEQVRNQDLGSPLGPVVCISPWNFPLAIFMGQIVAALVTGNPVLAKPAEQTPLIASAAVALMHAAGVPREALQLLLGSGDKVGAGLVQDYRVKGVLFTGSTEVAQWINRTLSHRQEEIPLIAETGGLNAMIVDSSALPEQVINDVISSAFDSTGQRCSALRVLLVQADIADHIIALLQGAMMELQIGDPAVLSTDIGPIIDQTAKIRLESYRQQLYSSDQARCIAETPLPKNIPSGHFFAPIAFELTAIDGYQLPEREIFGPILHVIRWKPGDLDQVVAAINQAGYGLTFGIHSRIDQTVDYVTRRIRAGNLYVNRNMIGAVVGVQPFGGEGKSGTGPKAGGPMYLKRLTQQVVPTVTSASPAIALSDDAVQQAFLSFEYQTYQLKKSASLSEKIEIVSSADSDLMRPLTPSYRQTLLEKLVQVVPTVLKAIPQYYLDELLPAHIKLPGPTGEDNYWYPRPRGLALCLGGKHKQLVAWLGQCCAAVAGGNPILLGKVHLAESFDSAIQHLVLLLLELGWPIEATNHPWPNLLETRPIKQVLVSQASDFLGLATRLTQTGEVIIPLICASNEDYWHYPVWRLITECVISTNTTAAGGNASLLTQAAEEID